MLTNAEYLLLSVLVGVQAFHFKDEKAVVALSRYRLVEQWPGLPKVWRITEAGRRALAEQAGGER